MDIKNNNNLNFGELKTFAQMNNYNKQNIAQQTPSADNSKQTQYTQTAAQNNAMLAPSLTPQPSSDTIIIAGKEIKKKTAIAALIGSITTLTAGIVFANSMIKKGNIMLENNKEAGLFKKFREGLRTFTKKGNEDYEKAVNKNNPSNTPKQKQLNQEPSINESQKQESIVVESQKEESDTNKLLNQEQLNQEQAKEKQLEGEPENIEKNLDNSSDDSIIKITEDEASMDDTALLKQEEQEQIVASSDDTKVVVQDSKEPPFDNGALTLEEIEEVLENKEKFLGNAVVDTKNSTGARPATNSPKNEDIQNLVQDKKPLAEVQHSDEILIADKNNDAVVVQPADSSKTNSEKGQSQDVLTADANNSAQKEQVETEFKPEAKEADGKEQVSEQKLLEEESEIIVQEDDLFPPSEVDSAFGFPEDTLKQGAEASEKAAAATLSADSSKKIPDATVQQGETQPEIHSEPKLHRVAWNVGYKNQLAANTPIEQSEIIPLQELIKKDFIYSEYDISGKETLSMIDRAALQSKNPAAHKKYWQNLDDKLAQQRVQRQTTDDFAQSVNKAKQLKQQELNEQSAAAQRLEEEMAAALDASGADIGDYASISAIQRAKFSDEQAQKYEENLNARKNANAAKTIAAAAKAQAQTQNPMQASMDDMLKAADSAQALSIENISPGEETKLTGTQTLKLGKTWFDEYQKNIAEIAKKNASARNADYRKATAQETSLKSALKTKPVSANPHVQLDYLNEDLAHAMEDTIKAMSAGQTLKKECSIEDLNEIYSDIQEAVNKMYAAKQTLADFNLKNANSDILLNTVSDYNTSLLDTYQILYNFAEKLPSNVDEKAKAALMNQLKTSMELVKTPLA